MRKIVAGMMVSVDGVVEAPEAWTGLTLSHSQALDRGVIQIVYSAAPTQDGAHHA